MYYTSQYCFLQELFPNPYGNFPGISAKNFAAAPVPS